jgi:hypothetical protein
MIYDVWGYPIKRAAGFLRPFTRYQTEGYADAVSEQFISIEEPDNLEECAMPNVVLTRTAINPDPDPINKKKPKKKPAVITVTPAPPKK